MNLKNKVIIITGASSGLGKEIALKAADFGAKVILISNQGSELEEVDIEIKNKKGSSEFYVCDIKKLDEVKKTIKKVESEYDKIDIVINNAGVWTEDDLEKENPNLRKDAFETNSLGNIQFIEEVLPVLKKQNEGYIFNVISTAGVSGIAEGDNTNWKTYGATKWAMTGYTKALRDSLVDSSIKVSGFFPGGFDSKLYERVGRENPHNQPWMMDAKDVADVVIFALTRPTDLLIQSIVATKC